jgi:hypothetical protein
LAIVGFRREAMANNPVGMLALMDSGYYRKPGCEVGWCGYPAVPPPGQTLCFFGGWLSAYNEDLKTYFVNGTVIEGVSGGPCFLRERIICQH